MIILGLAGIFLVSYFNKVKEEKNSSNLVGEIRVAE